MVNYFLPFENEEVIKECFERLGISGESITSVQLNSARRNLNLLLLNWNNGSINLWSLEVDYLDMKKGTCKYLIDSFVTDITQINCRTYTNQLGGIASSNSKDTDDGKGGGNATNVFIPGNNIVCNQINVDGNITYDYGINSPAISFLGIQTSESKVYSFTLEGLKNDGTYLKLLEIGGYEFKEFVTSWFDLDTVDNFSKYKFTVLDGDTISLTQLYFANNISDLKMAKISRDSYLSYPNKIMPGRPMAYYFNRQILPELNVWLTPDINFTYVLQYSFTSLINSADQYFDTAEVPAKMFPALITGLTWMLSCNRLLMQDKYDLALSTECKVQYDQDFKMATDKDVENVDLTLNLDLSKYY